MFILNKTLSTLVPFIPKSITYQIAKRYVAGINKRSALEVVKELNDKGYSATLDILGEHTQTSNQANQITNEYIEIYDQIESLGLDCNISLKPTHIGADLSTDIFYANLEKIIDVSERTNNFLRIDMESSKYTDLTINTFNDFKKKNVSIGTVFQAYLHRTFNDIKKIDTNNLNFRLCKGIYKENNQICINDRKKINDNYLKILRYAFENDIYIGIATHDTELLNFIYILIDEFKVASNRFEFQVLYGVPMHGWNKKNLSNGYKVRIYVPFGDDWYKYSIRRLKENPDIAGYVLKNFFSK